MRSSFSVSSSVSLKTGMPVQVASTSAISSSSTSERMSISPDFHSRSRRWRSSSSWRSSSRRPAAFSKSCESIADSLRRRTSAIFSSTSRTSGGAVMRRIRIRDPASSINAQDPGAILTGFVQFINANDATTRGIDVEANHRMTLGNGMGRMTFRGTWTHLLEQSVTRPDGTKFEYAGTHGDCHITNCMGTPRNRIQLAATIGIDDAQHRFGLRQIETPGKKRTQRKLARASEASAGLTSGFQRGFEDGR